MSNIEAIVLGALVGLVIVAVLEWYVDERTKHD